MAFVPGLALARGFFTECVDPLLRKHWPELRCAAALIGDGSEVLGYDTPISVDHDWGPRVLLFVSADDFIFRARDVIPHLVNVLPTEYQGWPIAFRDAGRPEGINRHTGAAGSWDHGVEMHDMSAWLRRQIGVSPLQQHLSLMDWLSIPEQALLSVTRGEVFRDDLGQLAAVRQALAWFPRDVWLFKLGCVWARVAEETAFVGRCGDVGDDLGSRIIAARLVQCAMRIAFLIEQRYAPYPKWFGRAFSELDCAAELKPRLEAVFEASTWRLREERLGEAFLALHAQQAHRGLPGQVTATVMRYHERPYHVINAAQIAADVFVGIRDPKVRAWPRIGAVDQLVDHPAILTQRRRARAVADAMFGKPL